MFSQKFHNRLARRRRIRARIAGTTERPRMCVFRSLRNISVQIIDDESGKTLAQASTSELGTAKKPAVPNVETATKLGALIAKKAKDAKIETVVFDRGGFHYHGRIKALADAAREGGLTF